MTNKDNLVYRTKQYTIKSCDTEIFNFCDDVCYKAKNLRNSANYHLRQCFAFGKKDTSELRKEDVEYLDEINTYLKAFGDHSLEVKEKALKKLLDKYDKTPSDNLKKKIETKQKQINNYKYPKLVGQAYDNELISYEFLAYYYPNHFKETEEYTNPYKELMAQVSQQILKNLFNDWKSFFKALQAYKRNPSTFTGRPKLPSYKKKDGRIKVSYTNQTIKFKNGILSFGGSTVKYNCSELPSNAKLQEVRIVPRGINYNLEIVYSIPRETNNLIDKNKCLAIDLGISNLATLTNNIGLEPIIINGRKLKNINQLYNKQRAKYKSLQPFVTKARYDRKKGINVVEKKQIGDTKKLKRITNKRNRRVKDYLHKTSKWIIDYCLKNKIGTIVIGKNTDWQRNSNIGATNNQNFVTIPYSQLIEMIKYKAEFVGIEVIEQEESYTSKASFLDNDEIPVFDKNNKQEYIFNGKRIKRGLYKTSKGYLINADVNGSLNIMRKFNSELTKSIKISDVLKYPRIVNVA